MWLIVFTFQYTTAALNNGVLTSAARNEIINALAKLIMVNTRYPSAKKLERLAEKLVIQHPTLRDSVGSGYVSCTYMYTVFN